MSLRSVNQCVRAVIACTLHSTAIGRNSPPPIGRCRRAAEGVLADRGGRGDTLAFEPWSRPTGSRGETEATSQGSLQWRRPIPSFMQICTRANSNGIQ